MKKFGYVLVSSSMLISEKNLSLNNVEDNKNLQGDPTPKTSRKTNLIIFSI